MREWIGKNLSDFGKIDHVKRRGERQGKRGMDKNSGVD
jgi:hypothetical protein